VRLAIEKVWILGCLSEFGGGNCGKYDRILMRTEQNLYPINGTVLLKER